MGCATSAISSSGDARKKEQNGDDNPFAPQEVVLTEKHKKVIVKNWKLLSMDLTGRGSRIFVLIFARNPLVKSLFSCGHLEGEELLQDERFKGHASRFMQAVGAVVDNIDNYRDALAPLLNDLGRRHVQFKGFKPIYFNDFQDSIMQVFAEDLGSKFNSFARESWRLVFLFILTELKRGYTQCLREKGLLNQAQNDNPSPLQPDTTPVITINDDNGDNSVSNVKNDNKSSDSNSADDREQQISSLFAAYKTG